MAYKGIWREVWKVWSMIEPSPFFNFFLISPKAIKAKNWLRGKGKNLVHTTFFHSFCITASSISVGLGKGRIVSPREPGRFKHARLTGKGDKAKEGKCMKGGNDDEKGVE